MDKRAINKFKENSYYHVFCKDESYGWKLFEYGQLRIWFKGYLDELTPESLLIKLSEIDKQSITEYINSISGHYAFIAELSWGVCASVDKVGTIPVFYTHNGSKWIIGTCAREVLSASESQTILKEEVTLFSMTGYTIGSNTLYKELKTLDAGECVLFEADRSPARHRYYLYLPNKYSDNANRQYESELEEVTRNIFKKMINGINNRHVIIPLSAGLDSRLVASALAELGYKNVICYSYGQKNNFEANAASKIANQLGFEWIFIENTPEQQRRTFKSSECKNYEYFADPLNSILFQQEYYAVDELRKSGKIPDDAVFVNGQAGDFISGNHIPMELIENNNLDNVDDRWKLISKCLIKKHFSLWEILKTDERLKYVEERIRDAVNELTGGLGEAADDFAIYEMFEFYNRQVKYVAAGQRIYEWNGYDWRLPLWDNDYIDFWLSVPLSRKRNQNLYRDVLEKLNWGGVWGKDWQFNQNIIPNWITPIRTLLKMAHVISGKEKWHRFEKRYIECWTDITCNYAIAPYKEIMMDKRGHRNASSWHTEEYLNQKGFGFNGVLL